MTELCADCNVRGGVLSSSSSASAIFFSDSSVAMSSGPLGTFSAEGASADSV